MLRLIFAYAVLNYKADHKLRPLSLRSTYKAPKTRKGQTRYSHGLYTYNCSASWKTMLLKRIQNQFQLMEKHPSTDVSYHPTEHSAIINLEGNGTQKSSTLCWTGTHTTTDGYLTSEDIHAQDKVMFVSIITEFVFTVPENKWFARTKRVSLNLFISL